MNHLLAMKISTLLTKEPESIATIKIGYLLETIIGEAEKCLMIIIFFMILRKVEYGIIMVCTLALLRPLVGGVHCTSYAGCFVYSLCVCMCPMAVNECMGIKINAIAQMIFAIFFLVYIAARAPVQSKSRPIHTRKAAEKIKIKALIMLLIINLCSVVLPEYRQEIVIMTMLIMFNALLGEVTNKLAEKGGKNEREINKETGKCINGYDQE